MGLAFYGIHFGSWENMDLNGGAVLERACAHTQRKKKTDNSGELTQETTFQLIKASKNFQVHVITVLCDLKKKILSEEPHL